MTKPVRDADPVTREAESQGVAAGRTAGATPATGASHPHLARQRLLLAARSALYALDYLLGHGEQQGISSLILALDAAELNDLAKCQGNLRAALREAA